jgi:hypothetical protein
MFLCPFLAFVPLLLPFTYFCQAASSQSLEGGIDGSIKEAGLGQ